jgi:hypothetical protein
MTGYTMRARAARRKTGAAALGAAALGLAMLGGCTGMMMSHGDVQRPAEDQFGLGPRASAGGLYQATLEPAEELRVRRMHTVKLNVRTASGEAVEGASIRVDGGMPEHGHGLPTTPRVTQSLGDGAYRVDGLKFNMGGWWELKFRVASEAGTDSVTFNLDL